MSEARTFTQEQQQEMYAMLHSIVRVGAPQPLSNYAGLSPEQARGRVVYRVRQRMLTMFPDIRQGEGES